VRRRALQLRPKLLPPGATAPRDEVDVGGLEPLARAMDHVSGGPLLPGNAVTLLDSGDAAYPAMLAAIDAAQRSVALCTYIFDRDAVGEQFVDALGRAATRGVEVRVLIDAFGARYSLRTVLPLLRRRGVRAARFLPARPWRASFLNLRNHRKILAAPPAPRPAT
jgi:cardiolipin synthase